MQDHGSARRNRCLDGRVKPGHDKEEAGRIGRLARRARLP
jgi:hypothetical protein